jgi:hypothetical protein
MASTKKRAPASMLGLNAALLPEVDDPLGTLRKNAGVEAYNEAQRQRDPRYMSGPLANREWSGFLASLPDNVKLGQDAARPEGIADAPEFTTSGDVGALHRPVDPNTLTTQDLENQRLMQSNNIVTPALRGLLKARR